MVELTIHEKLADIQQRLHVPKGQQNNFGNYAYRNIEDIEAGVKPLLKEHGLILTFNDDIVEVGGRVYVKATCSLDDGQVSIKNAAFAREAEAKKGMDDAQITGAASSYARKYAAGGLFLIDNGKDADSMDNSAYKPVKRVTPDYKARAFNEFKDQGIDNAEIMTSIVQKAIGKKVIETDADADAVIAELRGSIE